MRLVAAGGVAISLCLFVNKSSAFGPTVNGNEDKTDHSKRIEGSVLYPITYSEYDVTDVLLCGGNPIKQSDCWSDGNGKSYRYGCNSGDNRVYTNECNSDNCEASTCGEDWTWESETTNQCFDDKTVFFNYSCHAPEIQGTMPTYTNGGKMTDKLTDKKACAQLGWPLNGGTATVCATSKKDGECLANADFEGATKTCSALGGRLCTAEELMNDEAKGTGCKGDCARVWTSDTCNGGAFSTAGAKKCENKHPKKCSQSSEMLMVRCCSDASVSTNGDSDVVNVDSGMPEGYMVSLFRDYSNSSDCGKPGLATKTSNCYQLPTGGAMRSACRASSDYIWFQDCSDSSCNNCSGEWFTQGERTGKCYVDSSSNAYYDYACNMN